MPNRIDLFDPSKLDQHEDNFLSLIRAGEMLTWIHANNLDPDKAVAFLKAVSHVLNSLQRKGRIAGYVEVATAGQRLPIVSDIVVLPEKIRDIGPG